MDGQTEDEGQVGGAEGGRDHGAQGRVDTRPGGEDDSRPDGDDAVGDGALSWRGEPGEAELPQNVHV